MTASTSSKQFKAEVIGRCVGIPPFQRLNRDQITSLYEIVNDEAEGFDGEPISLDYMITNMTIRFNRLGLTPSRN